MPARERLYIFIIGMLFANAILTLLLFTGYLAKPSWVVPQNSIVVAKDFISAIEDKKK